MHEDPAAAPPMRPIAPSGPLYELADRLRALRGDPRVGAVAVVAVALAAGAFWFRSATAAPSTGAARAGGGSSGAPAVVVASSTGATATVARSAPAPSSTTLPVSVVVHVAGAVRRPGVVTLPAGSRVVDAIAAAGGGVHEADLDRLNLAAPLADGQRVLVARVGDPPDTFYSGAGEGQQGGSPAGSAGGSAAPPPDSAPSGPLDLNMATQAELEALPGIGPSLASAIIEERTHRGGYTDLSQLQQVPGIGERRFAQLRGLVSL